MTKGIDPLSHVTSDIIVYATCALTLLSYIKDLLYFMVLKAGFKPATYCFVDSYSVL